MKRILLLCGILVAVTANVHAQSGRPVLAPKSDFTTGIKQFDSLMALGKVSAAQTILNQLNETMRIQVGYGKYKISDAIAAKDNTAIAAGQKNIHDKWDLYNEMSNYVNNPATNQAAIDKDLNAFVLVMD